MKNRLWVDLRINGFNPDSVPESEKHHGIVMVPEADAAAAQARKTFPILKGEGAKIDYQLVADHAEQARANHYQTVERLAERGGLSWCELYAVLHNRKWEKIETNEAMIACRALEARYLAALAPDAGTAELAKLRQSNEGFQRNSRETWEAMVAMRDSINEHIPMPSLESDLLQGPENSVFCATVAEAVVKALAERDTLAAEIATWPQHMRDNFRRISGQREVMKKIAESQK